MSQSEGPTPKQWNSFLPDRYEVLIGDKVHGPIETQALRTAPGFMLSTPVRAVGDNEWRPAYQVINLKTYFKVSSKPPEDDPFSTLFPRSLVPRHKVSFPEDTGI